jgi:hypothetical protein
VRAPLSADALAGLRRARAVRAAGPSRVVYGYYPYWVAGLDTIRWASLTHLAWFSIELDATGAVTASHGWPDAATVAAAHAAGVKVDLTFTVFSGAGNTALCADPARRAATIATMIERMEAGGADGISVDFEGLIDGTRDNFTTFIRELRAGLDARGHLAAEISIAGPEVNWAGADGVPEFDLPALLDSASYYFVMGYGYFWSGSSTAGPIGILDVDAAWRAATSWSMERTLAGFASSRRARRGQIIHGVPYYGREWVTASDQPVAAAQPRRRGDLAPAPPRAGQRPGPALGSGQRLALVRVAGDRAVAPGLVRRRREPGAQVPADRRPGPGRRRHLGAQLRQAARGAVGPARDHLRRAAPGRQPRRAAPIASLPFHATPPRSTGPGGINRYACARPSSRTVASGCTRSSCASPAS